MQIKKIIMYVRGVVLNTKQVDSLWFNTILVRIERVTELFYYPEKDDDGKLWLEKKLIYEVNVNHNMIDCILVGVRGAILYKNV